MVCNFSQEQYFKIYRKKAKRKKLKKRFFIISLFIFFFFFLIFLYLGNIVNPIILSYAKSQTLNLLVNSCNSSIAEVNNIAYTDLIEIRYSSNNEISSITANVQKVNELSNILAQKTQNKIFNKISLGISIPIGTCSGIVFFTGKGSCIKIKTNPISNVLCSFNTKFSSAGINQTLHKIFVTIESEAQLALPFKIETINKKIDYLICETIIVGKIPNVYFNANSLKDLI